MKLALVTETFPPEVNGVAMTFGVIARELSRRGHAVTVYHPRRDDLRPLEEAPPEYLTVPLAGLPIPGYPLLRLGVPARRKLLRMWSAARPDLVHVATEGPLGVTAIAAARALGIPVTSSFHTNFHRYTRHYGFGLLHRPVLGWLRYVHNRTRCTFAPTRDLCDELQSLGFRELRVMSRGVDTEQFHPQRRSSSLRAEWGAGDDDPVVLHVGRMAAEKNYELLFQAYAAMRKQNPKLRFVLAGDGPLRPQLQREHPECIFAGFFSRAEIGRYYASADIYIHASLSETFGNVLTEAMASGLAVVSFDYAAGRQFVRGGRNGLLANCHDPQGLIAASLRLATDSALRNQLRREARSAVEAQSWQRMIGQFEADLLTEAFSTTASGPALVSA